MEQTEINQKQKYTHCATCGTLLQNTYFTFIEESLQGTVFYELDGSDNAFCSKNCACGMLRLMKRANHEQ